MNSLRPKGRSCLTCQTNCSNCQIFSNINSYFSHLKEFSVSKFVLRLTIEVKLKELIAFDRDTLTNFAQNRVEIDLDDGVKVNYCKFSDVLYEIKGLY